MGKTQRRRLLQLVAGGFAATAWSRFVRAQPSADGSSTEDSPTDFGDFDPSNFNPARHGFGFSNWAGSTGRDANGEQFTYEPGEVSRGGVQRAINDSWTTAPSEALTVIMTRIVYSWIGGQAATNGHCYGMAHVVDDYFQNPSRLPAGVDAASNIPRPTGEYGAVGDSIRRLQTVQLLHEEPYWYGLFSLRWGLADPSAWLEPLIGAIDATGTSAVGLDGESGVHLVLAHGYEQADGVTDVFVYDPNYGAVDYENLGDVWTLSVDSESGEILDIRDGYDQFFHHDPGMDISAVDALIESRNRVLDALSNAVFLGLETGGTLEIDVPEDVLVDRPAAEYDDPDRAPYADTAVVFGPLNEFKIAIDGEVGEKYSLDILGLRDGDRVLEEILSDTFEEGVAQLRFTVDEAGEFVVDVVEDVEEAAAGAVEDAEEAVEDAEEAVEDGAEEGAEVAEEDAERAEENAEGAEEGAEDGAEDPGETNDETGWIDDRWWIVAAGGALGLGTAYRFLAHRLGDEEQKEEQKEEET